jgi:hypothetical protein
MDTIESHIAIESQGYHESQLPLLKQKALAKDMSLPFAESLEGLNIGAHP